MDNIFVNSENSKTPEPYRSLIILLSKIILKRSDKYVALSNLGIYYTGRNIKSHVITINFKYQLQRGMKKLNYLMDHILYQIFNIISSISLKNMKW